MILKIILTIREIKRKTNKQSVIFVVFYASVTRCLKALIKVYIEAVIMNKHILQGS